MLFYSFVFLPVATVLTVYGIETINTRELNKVFFMLQQYLPFTVLKPKQINQRINPLHFCVEVATVLTVYGIETVEMKSEIPNAPQGCNSTYRLRY